MTEKITMTKTQMRAIQIWSALTYAASHSHILTYGELANATGLAAFGMGRALGYIQDHCQETKDMPGLTALVVKTNEGEPESGFAKEKACEEQMKVFKHPWSMQEANAFIQFVLGKEAGVIDSEE